MLGPLPYFHRIVVVVATLMTAIGSGRLDRALHRRTRWPWVAARWSAA